MYQSQQFHTSNYRGNQQGHDNYLRADSQSPSTYGAQNVTSQYRGIQKSFQPTGPVNSVYGQTSGFGGSSYNSNAGGVSMSTSSYGAQGSIGAMGTQNYHTASYRGNQPGHDNYLHEDSRTPAQSQYGIGAAGTSYSSGGYGSTSNLNFNAGGAALSSYNNAGSINTGIGQSSYSGGYSQNQFVSPDSYHTASYRGNQPGHDNYLHEDSRTPAQSQYGIGATGSNYNTSGGYNTSNLNFNAGGAALSSYNTAGGIGINTGIGQTGFSGGYSQGQNQFVSPDSYHTANYRGNQPGHDNYLHEDSRTPAQNQFGGGMNGGFNTGFGGNRY